MNRFHLIQAIILLLSLSAAHATTYVVDGTNPATADGNAGTADKPLRTIGAAAAKAQAGDTVLVQPGTYRETVSLKQSGTAQQPITFQAAKAGEVIVTGADPLSGWTRDNAGKPVYTVAWPHDFIIDTRPDGSKVRNHMAPAPVGCAEEVVWNGVPLRQVMQYDQLQPGNFFVDWTAHRLSVWLPGGLDATKTAVLGATRGLLLAPAGKGAGEYITLRGFRFRYASNFAQRNMVQATTGWHVEDCIFEWANGGGLSTGGHDIVVQRCVFQDNGEAGLGGSGKNLLFQDCIVRRNNWKGFDPGNEGGGCKFVQSDGVRVVNVESYENTGPGWWFDWSNSNFEVTGCTFHGNRGLKADWEGAGLFTEANDGPGRIVGNTIYSNTGAGIGIAESQAIEVRDNTLVDNGSGVEFRAMEGRANHKLEGVVVAHNRFRNWRNFAVNTSLGTWSNTSPVDKKLTLDGNTYDAPRAQPLYNWAGHALKTLDDVRAALGQEQTGTFALVPFTTPLDKSMTVRQQQLVSIDGALAKAHVGDTVVIPANGRTWFQGDTLQVFDLNNRYLSISVPDAKLRQTLLQRIEPYPRSQPVLLQVKVTKLTPVTDMAAVAVQVVSEADCNCAF